MGSCHDVLEKGCMGDLISVVDEFRSETKKKDWMHAVRAAPVRLMNVLRENIVDTF